MLVGYKDTLDKGLSNKWIKRGDYCEKKEQIREILLMPICCDRKHDRILRVDNKIQTGQKYYSNPDEDMSDFAIGFYDIVYKDILNSNPILKDNGYLLNKEFAGDTMNNFNTTANITPGVGKYYKKRTDEEKWPKYLQNYYSKYHCLANFWILPMEIGRTIKGALNKSTNPVKDYMDRFLEMVHSEIRFDGGDREYFRCFKSWDEFNGKNFLINAYLDQELKVDLYSNYNKDRSEDFIEKALEKIKYRAECIAKSKYAEELWHYFNYWQLF